MFLLILSRDHLNVPVRPVLSEDDDLGLPAALLHKVGSLLKLESSRQVVIENLDGHDVPFPNLWQSSFKFY